MKKVIVVFTIIVFTLSRITAAITGTIKDASTMEPLAGAVAGAVLDSIVVDAAIADADGRFELSQIDPSTFGGYLNISCLGYGEARYEVAPHIEALLTAEATELREVSVTQQALRVESGKFIFTPGAIAQAVNAAWDVLAYTPLLSITRGVLTMVSKEKVIIWINGLLPDLPQDAVLQFLHNFPPEQIARIEVITNAGSRYGINTGIINIVLKRELDGYYLNARGTGDWNYERVDGSGSVLGFTSFDKYRVSAYAGYNNESAVMRSDNEYHFHNDNSSRTQSIVDDHTFSSYNATLSFTYQPNKRIFSGVSGAISGIKYNYNQTTESRSFDALGNASDGLCTYYERFKPFTSPHASFSGFYIHYLNDMQSNVEVRAYGTIIDRPENSGYYENGMLQYSEEVRSRFHSAGTLAEFQKYFSNGSCLTSGYTFYYGSYKDRQHLVSGEDLFNYTDITNTIYSDFSHKFNENVSLMAGMRAQWIHTMGHQFVNDEHFSNVDFEIIPNINLSFNLPHNQTLSIDYSHSINRPDYTYLNPRVIRIDDHTFQTGNMDLRNNRSIYLNVNYSFLKYFTLSTSYSHNSGWYYELKTTDADDNVWISRQNVGSSNGFRADLRAKFPLFDNRLLICMQGVYQWEKTNMPDELADYRRKSSTLRWYPDVYWTISKRYKISSSFSFYPGNTTHMVGETFHRASQIWMSVDKEFEFGGKVSLTYGTFFSDNNRKTYDTDEFYYSLNSRGYSTSVSLSFSYTLYKGRPRQAVERGDTGANRTFTTH